MQKQGNFCLKNGQPRTWILQSPHSGDNTQLRAIAGRLGWPVETKKLAYRGHEGLLRLLSLPTLAGVNLAASSPLTAPWPDLVICSGRGAEAVAFWLRTRNPQLRIVFVGTPWSDLRRFDLVITTPQYRLPQAPNVLHNLLPVHDVTPQRLAAEAERWAPKLAHLPRPVTAVLVGGSSGPYHFTPQAAARLGREASALAASDGGSLLVTTSARTGTAAEDALQAAITAPCFFHRWQPDAADNPFHAMLGLASRIIVTADSISMMAEAVSTVKPVLLFDIEEGPYAMRADLDVPRIGRRGRRLEATFFRLLINHAPPRFSRDLRVVHRQLVRSGHARWLGEPPPASAPAPLEDGLSRSVTRIRALFGL
ncbi:mitochondrial fission ELM1 family protein [Aestuariivirga litoralis]|uniref:mitochondrial fission ELM1 family protein n=1 Tax=Aestuariivirga litoralis TaxID=2650924 RepID=UPI00137A3CDE|nr:ELM1/GtrOC1 family putative glycosyltransferase [Aestuariivirga litoralis]